MTLLQLLKACKDRNIILAADAGKLIVTAPEGGMDPQLRDALKAAKADLLPLVAAGATEREPAAEEADTPRGTPRAPMPLSPYQLPFWASHSDDGPGKAMPTIAEAFDFEARLEPQTLQQALDWTVTRHDMLRATFTPDASGVLRHTVHPRASVRLETRAAEGAGHARAVRDLLARTLAAPYDPERDTPLRAGLVNSPEAGSTVILAIAHLAGDGASLEVILKDIVVFLESLASGTPLPEVRPPQYGESLRRLEGGGPGGASSEADIRYWRRQLQGLPPVHGLPTDFTRAIDRKEAAFDFVMLTLPFGEALRTALRNEGISPFVFLHTAMRVLLYRFGAVREIPVVTPMANRQFLPEPEAVVGCFANEVALNIPLDTDASLAEALRRTRGHLAEALDHQTTPYTEVLRALHGQRSQDWLPLAQVFFSFLGLAADLPVRHRFDHVDGLDYDLSFIVADCKDRMKLMIGFDATLFEKATAKRLGALFSRICATMFEQRHSSPATLDLTPPGGATAGHPEEPWSLARALGLGPDVTVVFPEDEAAPVLERIRQAAAEAGAGIVSLATADLPARQGKTLLVTSGHPSRLAPLMRNGAASGLRICVVNHLPSALVLREMASWCPRGLLLLELPAGGSTFALADFDTCRELRADARFLTCAVDPLACTAAPGEQLDLGAGLQVQFVAPGALRIPLPSPTAAHVWHDGHALDLETLAARWSQASGESCAALSLAPAPNTGEDRLTAWIAPGARLKPAAGRLADLDARLPAHWPDYRVALSAAPLTAAGGVDRQALEHMPLLAPEPLADLEERFRAGHQIPVALRLEAPPAAPERIHHSRVIPKTEHLTFAGKYTPLELATTTKGRDAAGPSIACGPPLHLDVDISFRSHMERFRQRALVFIDIDGNETHFSGEEFLQRARHLLRAMQHRGLKPGDRVIIYCGREQELYALAWACLLGGICMAGLIPPVAGQSPESIHTRLGHMHAILGEPAVITTHDEPMPLQSATIHHFADLLEQGAQLGGEPAYHATTEDTPVYTAFTSGSTGAPKAVPLTAANVFAMIYAKMQTIGSIENETSLSMTALDHVASLFCNSIYSTVCGARQVYCSFQYILAEPTRILDIIHKFRVSHTWAPDFTWRQLYESLKGDKHAPQRWDLSCLRHIISAAENTREATFRNLEEALRPCGMPPRVLLHSWGMSETSSLLTMSDPWDGQSHEAHMGIIDAGRPMAGSAFRVADKNGTPVPAGDIGSFQVKGPSVLAGYYNNLKANAESFTQDGWFITGDLAMLRNGKVVFCGREKEQVVIKGQNIAQFDIEGFVDGIEGVEPTFSVVIGCRNEKTGDDDILVFAHTRLSAPDDRAALIRRVTAALAAHFGVVPARVLLVEQSDVPKALLGKIQRTNILKRFLAGEFDTHVLEADMLLGNSRTLPRWFVRKVWAKSTLRGVGPDVLARTLARRRIVLTGPDTNLAEALARRLTALGAHARHAPAEPPGEILRAEDGTSQAPTVVYLLDREPPQTAEQEHAAWRQRSFAPLYALAADLAKRQGEVCDLLVVTAGGQAVEESAARGPWAAAAAGLTASLGRQAGGIVRLVDLSGTTPDKDARAVALELALGGPEPLTAWHGGERMVPVLLPMEPPAPGASLEWAEAFGSAHYCLCTGVTGQLGRELLPQLLLATNGNFLVLGRKPRSEGAAFLEERCAAIPGWENRTFYAQAALDDAQSIREAMTAAAGHFEVAHGRPVTPAGLLHLAADTAERGFQDSDAQDLVEGLHLRQVHLETLEHAFSAGGGKGPRMVFSSVLSFWGGADSALYAPACALAEACVHNHRAQAPAMADCWHCFMWSRWKNASRQDDLIARLMAERGFLTIDAGQGAMSLMAMLHQSANAGPGTLMAGVDTGAPQIRRYMRLPGHKVHPLKTLAAYIPRDARADALRPFLRQRLGRQVPVRVHELVNPQFDEHGRLLPEDSGQADTAMPPSRTETRMRAIWADVLRLAHVDPCASFFELGGTSVLVPRLRKQVLDEFGVDLGSVGIFNYPSAREMAKAVRDDSDAPAQALAAGASASSRAQRQREARRARR
jgi:acyl-coenzyme A synthetase/AMP-(fatty) acid ligase